MMSPDYIVLRNCIVLRILVLFLRKFLLTNSQLGPTWTPGHEACETGWDRLVQNSRSWIEEQEIVPKSWVVVETQEVV